MQRQASVRLLNDGIQRLRQELKHDAQVVAEDEVVLHLDEVLLLELSAALVELLQDLCLDEALQNEFLLVFDYFDSVLAAGLHVDTLDYLAEGSLTKVADDFVLVAFWRDKDLVATQHVLAAAA